MLTEPPCGYDSRYHGGVYSTPAADKVIQFFFRRRCRISATSSPTRRQCSRSSLRCTGTVVEMALQMGSDYCGARPCTSSLCAPRANSPYTLIALAAVFHTAAPSTILMLYTFAPCLTDLTAHTSTALPHVTSSLMLEAHNVATWWSRRPK
jgi:hypothetical protein